MRQSKNDSRLGVARRRLKHRQKWVNFCHWRFAVFGFKGKWSVILKV
jgi:hypothetical protein